MATTALQHLERILAGQNYPEPNGLPIEPKDRELGTLTDSLTLNLMRAAGQLTLRDLAQNGPERSFGARGLQYLLQAQLMTLYGDKIGKNELADVRKKDKDWIVVAVPRPEGF